ncbi:membrane protein [Collibacillus ludicampi]|uniref:Membrane protein n=1 Tax=Collibacillus ludicampi TaxID=2771369 RepID=A0AAV4LGI9_9BACL|nr:EamA family transporter [Collibacillus ludicampi]GIM46955.1 membrane protein [Collibacillus ludicampi]
MVKKHIFGSLYLSLAASIWGGMYVVSKYVLTFVPPFTLLWLRYVIAFLLLAAILFFSREYKIGRRDWFTVAGIGFVGYFLSVGAQFVGTKWSDAHTGALITSASPAFILLFARLILKESLTVRKLCALILSTIGVIIVVGWGSGEQNNLWGDLFLVIAAVTWALLSVFAKQASQRLSSLAVTTYALLFAILYTTPVMFWELSRVDVIFPTRPLLWWGILYLGVVSTAGAFFLWNKGMELMDAGVGSLFFFFQPLVGSFLGWLLLGERLDWRFFAGGIFIIAGVLLSNLQKDKRLYVIKGNPVDWE